MAEQQVDLSQMLKNITGAIRTRSPERSFLTYSRVAADVHHALGGAAVKFALPAVRPSEEPHAYDGVVAVYAADLVAFLHLLGAPSAEHRMGPVLHPGFSITVLPRKNLVKVVVGAREKRLERVHTFELDGLTEFDWGTTLTLHYDGLDEPLKVQVDQYNQDLHKVHVSLLPDLLG